MSNESFLKEITASFSIPAGENPTVEMIEAAYAHHNLPRRYVNFEVTSELLGDAVRGARAMNFAGFNCSLPHKVVNQGIIGIKYWTGIDAEASVMRDRVIAILGL